MLDVREVRAATIRGATHLVPRNRPPSGAAEAAGRALRYHDYALQPPVD